MEVVVFGAGALGLGFLGPELAPECRITYLDIPAKADLLDHLHRDHSYAFNLTGLSMQAVEVTGVDGLCFGESTAEELDRLLDAADLVFTCVGEPALPRVAPALAAAALRRTADRPLRVLCSENGVDIAHKFRGFVEHEAADEPGRRLLIGDTVMGRMCKVVADPQPPVAPPGPGLDFAVVAEPFYGIPVQEHVTAGMARVPGAVDPQPPARFAASEDVKMLAHNGLHMVLACSGRLRGIGHFDELRHEPDLMELGRRLLADEAAAALLRKHGPALPRNAMLNYCDSILRRVTCPVLHDPIARGVRGVMHKLLPWERLVHSVRTVAAQGIEPAAYAAGLAAAVIVAQQSGETDMAFGDVLRQQCSFDPDAEADLIALIEVQHHRLGKTTT